MSVNIAYGSAAPSHQNNEMIHELQQTPSVQISNPDSQVDLRQDNSFQAKISLKESEAKLNKKITAGGHIFTSQTSISQNLDVSRQIQKLLKHHEKGLLGKQLNSIHTTLTAPQNNNQGSVSSQTGTLTLSQQLSTLEKSKLTGSQMDTVVNLNLSDDKLANIKSPTFLKLDSLINHLAHFRREFMGQRIPKYEQQFMLRKEEQMQRAHDARRKEEMLKLRAKRQSRRSSGQDKSDNTSPRITLLGGKTSRDPSISKERANISRKKIVESYRPNKYDQPLKAQSSARRYQPTVRFGDGTEQLLHPDRSQTYRYQEQYINNNSTLQSGNNNNLGAGVRSPIQLAEQSFDSSIL